MNKATRVIGIMSGTSLDGLDLALCDFKTDNSITTFDFIAAETFLYDPVWKEQLQNTFKASAEHYFELHSLYGQFIAEKVNQFLEKHKQTADFIASHACVCWARSLVFIIESSLQ